MTMQKEMFGELELDKKIVAAISEMGFEEPSPIQAATIPLVLEGSDVIGQAQTGTGKTAAFGIPIIQSIENYKHISALIMTPTRELAIQVAEEIGNIGRLRRIKALPVYGGQPIDRQIRALKSGVQIVIGTPGRLIDHINRGTIKLDHIKYLVLDEADEMLDMGFIDDIREIFQQSNVDARILLFSATMPAPILKIAADFMGEYDIIEEEKVVDEEDAIDFIQEAVNNPKNTNFKIKIIDPIIQTMESKEGRETYLKHGTEFIEANAEMLAREFPTKRVSFPLKYVDRVYEVFGFTQKTFRETIKELCKEIREDSEFKTIMASPTNIIHAVVLMYSDMVYNKHVRDSARQQLGLTVYNMMFNKFYKSLPDEKVMAYTYMHLNRNWDLVKAENMVTWIADIVDGAYAYHRSQLSLVMNLHAMIKFLNRLRAQMRQKMWSLANLYFKNQTDKNHINADSETGDDYIVSDDYSKIRDNLIRLIKNKDGMYSNESELYTSIAKLKNVSSKSLYNLSKKVSHHDISELIDLIFFVFFSFCSDWV